MTTQPGRVMPFSYVNYDSEDDELGHMLHYSRNKRPIHLLDIRLHPDDKQYPQWRQEYISSYQYRDQYLYLPSLGKINGGYMEEKLIPDLQMIVRKIARGDNFVLFSRDINHAKEIESRIRAMAESMDVGMENPYAINAGDSCLWTAKDRSDHANETPVAVNFRAGNPYTFHVASGINNSRGFEIQGWADVADLMLKEQSVYLCQKCKRGDINVVFYDKYEKNLCGHCKWECLDEED